MFSSDQLSLMTIAKANFARSFTTSYLPIKHDIILI